MLLLIITLLIMAGCSSDNNYYDIDEKYIDDSEQSIEYEEGYSEGYSDAEHEYEDVLDYYEVMCDELGLIPYDMAYEFEKWNRTVSNETKTVHHSYLCKDLNREEKNIIFSTSDFDVDYNNYKLCPTCGNNDEYYIYDREDNTIHKDKSHVHIEISDDYTTHTIYPMVSYEDAIENQCKICECCEK